MAKFYDLFSNYSPGDLIAQNPNYVLGATETLGTAIINSNGELVFTNGTGWGSGENLFYIGLAATTDLDVFAQIHNGQARVGVAGSKLTDMTSVNYGSYSTSRVNDSNTEIRRTVGTSSTTLVNNFSTQAGVGVFSKMRFNLSQAEGGILVRYKYWLATNPEPELWDVEYLDTSSVRVTDALIGAIHLRSGPGSSFRVIDWGVGTDGDSAPTQALTTENQTINIPSISSAEQFGSTVVSPGFASISSSSIDSAEHVNHPELIAGSVSLFVSSILTEEQFGNHQVLPAAALISLPGIPSSEHVYEVVFYAGGSAIFADGIAGDEQFGVVSFMPGPVAISAVAIASESIVSSPEFIAGPAVIYADSVPSAELFGDLTLFNVQQLIRLVGIDTAEAFGSTTLEGGADLSGWLTGRLNIKPAFVASVGVNRVH